MSTQESFIIIREGQEIGEFPGIRGRKHGFHVTFNIDTDIKISDILVHKPTGDKYCVTKIDSTVVFPAERKRVAFIKSYV